MQDAREAAAAVQNVMFEDGMYVLVLDVPVIQRAVGRRSAAERSARGLVNSGGSVRLAVNVLDNVTHL